jgi:hypothetical protein
MSEYTREYLERQKKPTLNRLAKSVKIVGYSKMKKEQLITYLLAPPPTSRARTRRKASSWAAALKEYNAGSNMFCMPRKGSPAYEQVKSISDRIKVGGVQPLKTEETKVEEESKPKTQAQLEGEKRRQAKILAERDRQEEYESEQAAFKAAYSNALPQSKTYKKRMVGNN